MSRSSDAELQTRIKAFLKRPVPQEAGPIPGSMAEAFLATYAAKGARGFDPEASELIELCISESAGLAEEGSAAQRAYFSENAALLSALLQEIHGAQ